MEAGMSRIKYNASIDTFQELWDGIDEAELTVKRDQGDKVTVEDASGNELEFSGANLDWTETGLAGGMVREISLSNADGKELFEIKAVGLEATAIQAAFDTDGLDGVLAAVLTGDDSIKGSKGDDWLIGLAGADKIDGDKGDDYLLGGEGDDLLIGSHGSDYFVFEEDGSSDFVKDFNLGNKGSDYIAVDADLVEAATWEQDGHNLVVSFGGEGTIVLKNVDAEDFSADYVVALPEETLI
jgi:Ca2+-binding RTX toxin-like protein